MPTKRKLRTLADIYTELTETPVKIRKAVREKLGVNSDQTFYQVLEGTRKLKPLEKKAIAEIFGVDESLINWQDEAKVIA